MAVKPMVRPFVPSHVRQHPVYANLYWRKIVYPSTYPSYSAQNSDENAIIANNFGELQTQESNYSNRRSPYRRPKKRKRRPSARPVNPEMADQHLAPLYPIPYPSMQPKMYYYKSPGYYQRKRRPVQHHYRPNYYYANHFPY